MAKQQSGETKTPVIVALVFFVLATITLGVLAYMFNGDAKTAEAAAATAKKDAETAKTEAGKAKEAMLIAKGIAGTLTEQERTDLQGLRFKEDTRKVHADMLKAIEDRAKAAISAEAGKFVGKAGGMGLNEKQVFAWDWPAGGELTPAPTKSLVDVAVTNYSQLKLAEGKFNQELASLDQAQKAIQALSAKLDQAQKAIDARTKEIPDEIAKGIKDARDQFEKFKVDFTKLTETQRKELQGKDDLLNERAVLIKRTQETSERLRYINDRLDEEMRAKVDPFQFDKPQGKVIRRTGQIVEIDLGSADNLRPGLTFSVMPTDTPQRGFESRMRDVRDIDGKTIRRIIPKGSIEVIEVMGPNLSQARITEEDSQVRDRILTGDLLYNAIWRRGTSEHIVLYGIFDIDGDGKDDVKTLKDDLTRMGVIVDAYFDLGTLKWVGDVTSQTTFAVEGYTPTVAISDGTREGKARIISAIAEARKTVKDRGIRVLRPRDFFPRVGYKAKLDVTEDTINMAATHFLRTLPAEQGGGGEVPPPKGN